MAIINALEIQVNKQGVFVNKLHELVNDSKNVYTATVKFDDEWDGFAKTIVWKNSASGSVVTLLNLTDDTVVIPNKVITKGSLYVGFYGHLDDYVLTTQPSNPIHIYGGCGTPPVIADVFQPSEYDTLMAEFATIYAACDEMRDIHTEIIDTADAVRQEYYEIQREYNELTEGLAHFNETIADFNEKFTTFETESGLVLDSVSADKTEIQTLKTQIQTMANQVAMNYENAELVFADIQSEKHDITQLANAVAENTADVAQNAQKAQENATLATESANSAYDFASESEIYAQRAQNSATSAHDTLDEIELYAGQVNRDVGKSKTYYDYIVANASNLMQYYIITFDGTTFKHNSTTLTFAQIKEKCLDTKNFVYAQYNNRLYIPQYISNNNIFFDAAYIDSSIPQMHRIAINNADQTSKYDYTLVKSSDVPTDQHINDLIDAKLAQLGGNGVSY